MVSSTCLASLFSFLVLLLETTSVGGNFFSRLLNTGDASAGSKSNDVLPIEGGIINAKLSNQGRIPLVGLGVGHTPRHFVGALVSEAVHDTKRIRLIDTASMSENEGFITQGILAGADQMNDGEKLEVHVVTKIWYTHLGYERTKMAVEKTLRSFEPALASDKVDLKIHVLLNWPRCYERVSSSGCANEEANLEESARQAGPDPTKNPSAWKESWKYLEEIYLSKNWPIESIGLSNFHLDEIEDMNSFARISPHILQVNMWSLLYDSFLIEFCHRNNIHVMVYNSLNDTIGKKQQTPHAYHHVQKVANELSQEAGLTVTPAQAVLSWTIQHGVTVIPRTFKIDRLEENSGVALMTVPTMTESQRETVAHAVEALISGIDLQDDVYVSVTFHALADDIMLYWIQPSGGELRIDHIWKGQTFNETTYPNHTYRAYNAHNKDVYTDFKIEANFGEHKHIYVDAFENDDTVRGSTGIPHLTTMVDSIK